MPSAKSGGAKPAATRQRAAKAAPKKRAAQTAKKSTSTELVKRTPTPSLARRAAKQALPVAGRAIRGVARAARGATQTVVEHGGRRLPIQRSIDVAVPVEVAWDEWMDLDVLPGGAPRDEAEVLEEREDESFAWQAVDGSDVAGLVTFHALAERLTRIELHLDVVPGGVTDAVSLLTRRADRRAEVELRRFKAEVESIDPDEYDNDSSEDEQERLGQ